MSTPGLFEFLLNPTPKTGENHAHWHQEETSQKKDPNETDISDETDNSSSPTHEEFEPICSQKKVEYVKDNPGYMTVYPGHKRVPRPPMRNRSNLIMNFNKSAPVQEQCQFQENQRQTRSDYGQMRSERQDYSQMRSERPEINQISSENNYQRTEHTQIRTEFTQQRPEKREYTQTRSEISECAHQRSDNVSVFTEPVQITQPRTEMDSSPHSDDVIVPSLFHPPIFGDAFKSTRENVNVDHYYRSVFNVDAMNFSNDSEMAKEESSPSSSPPSPFSFSTKYVIVIPSDSSRKFDTSVKGLSESIVNHTRAMKNGFDLLSITDSSPVDSQLANKWKSVIEEDNGKYGGQRACELPAGECRQCDDVLVDQIFYNRLISGYYSVKVCFDFEKYGLCKYGARCRYYHCPSELQSTIVKDDFVI